MKLLVIITESPWGASLSSAALRFVRAVLDEGHAVPAVFFKDDGVYHVLGGRLSDDGLPRPLNAWQSISGQGTRLLVCSAAAARRLDAKAAEISGGAFQEAGLAQLWDLASRSDRVVIF